MPQVFAKSLKHRFFAPVFSLAYFSKVVAIVGTIVLSFVLAYVSSGLCERLSSFFLLTHFGFAARRLLEERGLL